MTTLVEIKTRVRQVLEDPSAKRFSDGMLETAIRQALDRINEPLPLNATEEVVVSTSGRDQALTGLVDCLYLVTLTYPAGSTRARELEPETQFTYFLKAGVPTVHFSGELIPQAGKTISVRYAAQNRLLGLDGAASTSLPAACESALVNGASGYACQLRAGSLVEAFNVHPTEAATLLETGHLWLNLFEKALSGLKVLQEFGYPLGFPAGRLGQAWERIEMTYTLGEDCHILLAHPEVDAGAAYGFLLAEDNSSRSGGVQITREVDSGGSTQLWLHFDVLLSDRSANPDGTIHIRSRAQDYAKLCQFLGKRSGVAVTFSAGTLVDLGAVGWTADERHLPSYALVKCQFNNVGVYWPPIDPLLLSLSVWAVDDQLRGALTWNSSYWR